MLTQLGNDFEKVIAESKLEETEALKKFALEKDLTLYDLVVLIAERRTLGNIKFAALAEVITGRPIKYGAFYKELVWVVDAMEQTKKDVKFADIYRMACIKSKELNVELVPSYQVAYQYMRKVKGEKKEEIKG